LTQTALESVVSVNHYGVNAPPSTIDEELIQPRPSLLRAADPDVDVAGLRPMMSEIAAYSPAHAQVRRLQ